ncbi:hypothetical protein [Paenibacillus sp. FSL K6-0108]
MKEDTRVSILLYGEDLVSNRCRVLNLAREAIDMCDAKVIIP